MDEELKKILENHEKRIAYLELFLGEKKVFSSKKLSPKEFLLTGKPEGDVMKTLYLAYYLEKFEGLNSFATKDIEDAFRTAKESVPDNINYKIIKNIEKGFIVETKEKKDNLKTWNLTKSGEEYVESKTRQ